MALTNLSQITTSGIATGTDLNIRNITGAAATFTGNVTVGGTLTYEDVTNIDSVGLITARSGINVNSGDVNITSGNLALASATPMVVASNGSGHLRLGAGGSEKVRVTSAGNVGIGTHIPLNKLDVRSGISVYSPNGLVRYQLGVDNSNGVNLLSKNATGSYNTYQIDANTFEVRTTGTNSPVQRLRITSAGNVGINDSNPTAKLSVIGTQYVSANLFTGENYGIFFSGLNDYGAGVYGRNSGNDLVMNAGTGEKVRVTSAGNVGIGTNIISDNLEVFAPTNASLQIKGGAAGSDANRSAQLKLLASGSKLYVMEADATDGSFRILDSSTERLRIDSSGRLLLRSGTTASTDRVGGFHNSLQVEGTSAASSSVAIIRNSNDQNAAYLNFGKSRGTSLGSNTAVSAGDTLAIISFTGSDGSGSFNSHASIKASVDGATGNGDSPGRISLWTTPDGSASSLERLTIKSDGKIGINETSPDSLLHLKNNAVAGIRASLRLESSGTNNSANDTIGEILFAHNDSNDAGVSASIVCKAEDAAGNTYLQFNNGKPSALVEHLRITSAGLIGIGAANNTSYDTNAQNLLLASSGNTGMTIRSAGSTPFAMIHFADGTSDNSERRAGRIMYQHDGDNLTLHTANTERLRISGAGQIGMGKAGQVTANGNSPLTIQESDSNSETICLRATNSGGNGSQPGIVMKTAAGGHIGGIYCDVNSDYMRISTSGTDRIYISDAGNVGIGEASPDVRLHVKEQFDTAYSLTSVTTDANHLLKLENPSTTANAFAGMQFRVGSGADLYFGAIQQSINHGDFFFANQNSPQREMMRIKSSGQVGIGTDGPDAKLHVYQSDSTVYNTTSDQRSEAEIRITNPLETEGTFSSVNFYNGGGVGGDISLNAVKSGTNYISHFTIKQRSGGGSTDWSERFRIHSNGLVGINTTAPSSKLHINNGGNGSSAIEIDGDYLTVSPSLNLDFAKSRKLDDRIYFHRDSIGTYFDANGLLKVAGVHEPRFDHDPRTGQSLGLMIEETRTNLVNSSENPANWNVVHTAANETTYKIKGIPTVKLIDGGSDGDSPYLSGGAYGNGKVTMSVYIDAVNSTSSTVRMYLFGNGYGTIAWSLSGNVAATTGGFSYNGSNHSNGVAQTIDCGGGIYRLIMTFDYNGGSTTSRFYITPSGADSDYIYIAGMQLEQGGFATSYIPTSGSPVTRSQDRAEIKYDDWYNDESYKKPSTFAGRFRTYDLSATRMVAEGSNGSTLKDFSVNTIGNSANLQFAHRYTANNSYGNTSNAGVAANTDVNFAFSYDGTDGSLLGSANRTTPFTGTDDLGITSQAGGDRMRIGSRGDNSLFLNGTIAQLRYFPVQATSAQLLAQQ